MVSFLPLTYSFSHHLFPSLPLLPHSFFYNLSRPILNLYSLDLIRNIYCLNVNKIHSSSTSYTDKKENQNFLIYKEIQNGAFAKSYMTNGLLIYREIFAHLLMQSHIWLTASSYIGKYFRISSYIKKPFLIYDFATASLWISFNMRKILCPFLSVYSQGLLQLVSFHPDNLKPIQSLLRPQWKKYKNQASEFKASISIQIKPERNTSYELQ
jgi:hypothetical protein